MDAINRAFENIKSRLEQETWKRGDRLPSMEGLATLCKVSRSTMWRALALMQKSALVHTKRGGQIIAGPEEIVRLAPAPRELLWERLKKRIGQEILLGEFSDKVMPPLSKAALRYGVAINTLRKACDALAKEGLLVAKGRGFVPATLRPLIYRPAIVLVTLGDTERDVVLLDRRTRSVVESFERECPKSGHLGRTIGFNIHGAGSLVDISNKIKDIAPIAGFILNIWKPWDDALWRRWLDLFNFALSREVPIVVIDHAGTIQFSPSMVRSNRIRVLRIEGAKAGEKVGEALFRQGHRHVAYITPYNSFDWSKQRHAGLCRFYEQYGGIESKVELFALDEIEDEYELMLALLDMDKREIRGLFRNRASKEEMQGHLLHLDRIAEKKLAGRVFDQTVAATIRPIVRSLVDVGGRMNDAAVLARIQQAVLEVAGDTAHALYLRPLFQRVLSESDADGWVCSDERTARAAFHFIRGCGKKIPRDIALFSFDNWTEACELQLSGFDFNMNGAVQTALLLIADEKRLKSTPVISEIEGYVVERKSTRQ